MDQEDSDRNPRRGWWWAAGIGSLALLVAAGLTVFFVSGSGAESADGDCAVAPGSGVTKASDEPSDGEELRVTDFGAWPYDSFEGGEPTKMTFGFEVENPSEEVARNVELEYDFVDEDGEPALDESMGKGEQRMETPTILPGQRVGMGDWVFTQDKYVDLQDDPPSISYDDIEIEVDFLSAEWWPTNNDIHEFAEVTADPVEAYSRRTSAEFDFERNHGVDNAMIRSTVDSQHCSKVKAVASSVLLRDSDGDIVAGSPPNTNEAHPDSPKSLPPGEYEPYYSLSIWPEPADKSQTEVFPYTNPAKRSGK